MSEFIACSAAILVFAAVWLAVKSASLDWAADASLAGVKQQLSAERLALDGEVHGAALRLSLRKPARAASGARTPLINVLAAHARLAMPV